jgi:hypothetical protein
MNGLRVGLKKSIMFSKPLLGTNTKKTKLSWLEYIWFSCIIQGWANFYYAFKNWSDLMGNNYQDYALLKEDDPLELCILYFWDSLEDEIYPKFFLEELMQMVDDVDTGKVETVPFTKDMFDKLNDLVGDLIDDELEED